MAAPHLATISSITTYPIKGLAGQTHEAITVTKGGLLPGDRAYALSSGTKASLAAMGNEWLKKAHFLQMMKFEDLAALDLSFDPDSTHLRLSDKQADELLFEGALNNDKDAAILCAAMADYLDLESVPRLFHLADGGMTDTKTPYVAFGNTASISDFAQKTGLDDDERRFRLNVMMTGMPPLAEVGLIGKTLEIGTAAFEVCEPVGRCAAIEVDPQSAERRTGLVQALQDAYGTTDMGVFAKVVKAGHFKQGDEVRLA
jgi:uncharacterized protein YcbX